MKTEKSDGSSANYYKLPPGAKNLGEALAKKDIGENIKLILLICYGYEDAESFNDEFPVGANQLQHLISYKDMNAQIGEIFRAGYRYGEVEHSPKIRDAKKIKFYLEAEKERILRYGTSSTRKTSSVDLYMVNMMLVIIEKEIEQL